MLKRNFLLSIVEEKVCKNLDVGEGALHLKNILCKYGLLLLLSGLLSGCLLGKKRNVPDELDLVQYKPLLIPARVHLPVPDSQNKSLGYVPARQAVQEIFFGDKQKPQNTADELAILKMFAIKRTDRNIRESINALKGDTVVVDVMKEEERIKDNIKKGKSVKNGSTPRYTLRKKSRSIYKLFD